MCFELFDSFIKCHISMEKFFAGFIDKPGEPDFRWGFESAFDHCLARIAPRFHWLVPFGDGLQEKFREGSWWKRV